MIKDDSKLFEYISSCNIQPINEHATLKHFFIASFIKGQWFLMLVSVDPLLPLRKGGWVLT